MLPLISHYIHIAIYIRKNPKIMSNRYQLKRFMFYRLFLNVSFYCDDHAFYVVPLLLSEEEYGSV